MPYCRQYTNRSCEECLKNVTVSSSSETPNLSPCLKKFPSWKQDWSPAFVPDMLQIPPTYEGERAIPLVL
ncbi:hypothetical protein DV515_00015141 [Chloebia gouldiae]|uniref:Uncharacterized protein n=1 Tax=Chloebia gouldiae TaxID=44316 RepID=A0A3L8RW19_CHLGU|nr:hypothetical protein DV515_00015141 [Chloebia gouldiae]